jgi:hypothetical protein
VQQLVKREEMMISKSKLALVTAVALTGIAAPVFAHAMPMHRHRHHHAQRRIYNYRPVAVDPPAINPWDDPAMTGGGSEGYNECAGHPRC